MPTVQTAPIWLLPYMALDSAWWLYFGTGSAYATNGVTHHQISTVTHNATLDSNWTGGMLNGVPVVNNPVDGPYYLPGVDPLSNHLTALPNWTYGTVSAMTCRSMRPFKSFLIAYDVTKTVSSVTTRYPQLIKWSHPADPGSLPVSWNEASTQYDTGEYPLADTAGIILDALQMKDVNVVYKEDSTYIMQFVGGMFIFNFTKAFQTVGMLAQKCVGSLPTGQHVVLSQDDIVMHDGTTMQSIVDKRMRKALFNSIDTTYYNRSFVAVNRSTREVWVCIPESGQSLPSAAYVWNWRDNLWTLRTLNTPASIESGVANLNQDTTWDADSGTWDSDPSLWDAKSFNPSAQFFIGAHPNDTQLRQYDTGNDFAGVGYSSWAERIGIGIPFDAQEPPDMTTMKFLRRVIPRIEGTVGGTVNITLGSQNDVNATPVWDSPRPFIIGTTRTIDCRVSGRLLAIRFEADPGVAWKLHGYEFDVVRGGAF